MGLCWDGFRRIFVFQIGFSSSCYLGLHFQLVLDAPEVAPDVLFTILRSSWAFEAESLFGTISRTQVGSKIDPKTIPPGLQLDTIFQTFFIFENCPHEPNLGPPNAPKRVSHFCPPRLLVSSWDHFWVQVACRSLQVAQKGPSRAPKLSKFDAQDLQNGTQKYNFPCVAKGVGGMGVSH